MVSSYTSSSNMKRFVCHSIAFLVVMGGILGGACFFLKDTSAGKTMLGAQKEKLNQLAELPGRRIILLGGSGCGQGFVTSNLCATLKRPVYNMGLHAGLGIIYQMKAVEPLVRKGDTVLLFPEYANFDGSTCFGETELLMMVIDVIPEQKSLLTFRHWLHLLPLMPKYGADKLRHLFMPPSGKDLSNDFDGCGDRKIGEGLLPLAQVPFPPAHRMAGRDFSPAVLPYISDFVDKVRKKGGTVRLLPPAFQQSSYRRQVGYIQCISDAFKKIGIPFDASPERYALDDRYFCDTPYHLNLAGRQLRSQLCVEDLLHTDGF